MRLATCGMFETLFCQALSTDKPGQPWQEGDAMTEQEAIRLAIEALRAEGTAMGAKPARAIRKNRHMRLGKNRCGWLVIVPLDVPASFEPNSIYVEVYEPDGEVHIPITL
jgi:hypothetical protein